MNEKDKILADNLTRVTKATRFADTKVGIIATICAIYIGLSKNLVDAYIALATDTNAQHIARLKAITGVILSTLFMAITSISLSVVS